VATKQPGDGGELFPVTDWGLVDRAAHTGAGDKREALGILLLQYLPALKTHLVHRRGLRPDEADDLLQEFVAGKILEKDLIARADRGAGKFRTFLLTALCRFLINRVRDQRALKRAPSHGAVVSMGEHVDQIQAAEPDDAFHADWARRVIGEALRRMQIECRASGRDDLWGVFHCRVVGPIMEGTPPVDYRQLVERFHFRSPVQASNALTTAKRMYARMLNEVVGQYADDDEEIQSEIEDLHRILARMSS
jgi:RNA polymerase sigma-70 factor (ECF subfamily)